MRSASCTTRTGKHAINDATRDKPEVMQMMYWWVKGRPIHKTFFTHCCCSLHDCINKIKGLLPALSDIVSRFSKIIFSCINNGDDKKLVFSSCSGDQLKPPPRKCDFHIGPTAYLLQTRAIKILLLDTFSRLQIMLVTVISPVGLSYMM